MPIPASWTDKLLSVLRIVAALAFLEHGLSKFFGIPPFPMQGPLPPLLVAAATIELVGGALLAIGLFTRPVAFVLSGEMAFAYFMAYAPQGFWPVLNHGEAAVFYCFAFLYFSAAGGGPWSLDRMLRKV